MSSAQVAALLVGAFFGIVVLVGLSARQRLRHCLAFSVYLAFVVTLTLLLVTLPGVFYWLTVWGNVHFGYALLRHLVGLELAYHTFRAFPAARRLARSFVWVMTAVALAAPILFLPDDFTNRSSAIDLVLPMNLAALSLLAGLSVLILWYHLPLESMHKAIAMGLLAYLALYSLTLEGIRSLPAHWTEPLNAANSLAWLALCVYWAIVAWRPRRAGDGDMPPAPRPV